MGLLGTLLGIVGFGFGVPLGILVGYFIFIYFDSRDVKDPIIRPLRELDTNTLHAILPDIPFWVKNPDYERVDWLNEFIYDMWPYLDKAICALIRSTTKPIFDQYIGKYHIESIEFDHLTLGTLPPVIHGVKVYDTQEKQLVIQPVMRWAGNSNIVVVLNFFSLKITLQLFHIHVSLMPRITLKPLVPSFPCFANVTVSLMGKMLILDLNYSVEISCPSLAYIASQIANRYHWPKLLEIPILDNSSGATKRPVGILHVKVIRAFNLRKMDLLGKSDPYVKLKLSGERLPSKKTTIKMCNLNPEWNENFRLIVKDPEAQGLELHVYDWEKIKMHDKLGMQVVPLSCLTPHEAKEFTLDLLKNMNPNDPHNKRNRGKIVLELTYDPFKEENEGLSGFFSGERHSSIRIRRESQDVPLSAGVLSLTVESAENVEGKHHNNPFSLVLFRGEHKKTKVIKRSRDPRWDEEFQFMLEEPPFNEKILIKVMSKRNTFSFHSKESLGHVEINLTDVVNNGRINERYNLINSKNGVINIEIRWSTV